MAYGNFKDLNRTTAVDKWLSDKICNIFKNPKYARHQCGIASMVYNFFDKKFLVEQLKKKLCKMNNSLKIYRNQFFKNLKKKKVRSSFIDKIWGADLADI